MKKQETANLPWFKHLTYTTLELAVTLNFIMFPVTVVEYLNAS